MRLVDVFDVLDFADVAAIADDRQYLGVYREWQRLKAALNSRPDGVPAATVEAGYELVSALRAALAAYEVRKGDALRVGPWMPTPSGRRFWLQDPRPEEVDPYDLAWGLSRIPRFNGMTVAARPYSVAQHLVLASRLVPGKHALHALLHDAHEAYCQDVVSPLKKLIGESYATVEGRLKTAVSAAFGVAWDDGAERAVKAVDNLLLVTEARDLLGHGVIHGDLPVAPLDWLTITPWDQDEAYDQFLDRLGQLATLPV
jgi:5'-deoxynucleotidase YfbR-like HD superfamily hydrolase